jgi:hypothetical protein
LIPPSNFKEEDKIMRKVLLLLISIMPLFLIFPVSAWAYEVSPGDVSGDPGASIVVPIYIRDVGGLEVDAFSFTINFDPDVLSFVEADKTGTLVESFSLISGQEIAPGQVKVNGSLFGTPMKIRASGVFLKLTFIVKATFKNSALALSDFKDDIKEAFTSEAIFTRTGVPVSLNRCPLLSKLLVEQV